MQTRSSNENSVCLSVRPSVRLSVKRVICDKMEEISVHIVIKTKAKIETRECKTETVTKKLL